ncbi:hypothetical protein [Actinomadura madurae]|uniref:hypothetical protein n=1 Tax=Actinomadura madurae TaxID=1993 RepID=UPI0020D1FAE9|nr:hypothetical protein [Actinomadura madurae]MCQ0011164.1 hypothetical protein [Actinomadura madurae]
MDSPSPPFALGTFSGRDGTPFPGLVRDELVTDLRSVAATTRDLLERWDDVPPLLHSAAGTRSRWTG